MQKWHSKVYSLSTPMAALGVLSLNTVASVAPPPPWIDPNFIQGTEDNAQNFQVDAESFPDPPPMDPISYFFMLLELLLYLFVGICLLINAIQSVIQFFQGQQKSTPPPKKSLKPGQPGQGPLNNLTPAQERLHNDVKSRLGYATYDDAEIDALIRAGYLDPDAIAAIMRGGSFSIFIDPSVRAIATTLTQDQQKQFVAIVENYRKTHPGLTAHQVYNYLRDTKMKYQLQSLLDDLDGKTGDPISKALLSNPNLKLSIQGMRSDLYRKAGKILDPSIDPFTVSDDELSGWYSSMTGTWGEWGTIKQYYQQPGTHIVAISTPLINPVTGKPDSEVDLKIEENGVEKWVEIKNAQTTGQWSKAITQAGTYFKYGAKHVVIEWPQQGINGVPEPGTQQWTFFEQKKHNCCNNILVVLLKLERVKIIQIYISLLIHPHLTGERLFRNISIIVDIKIR